MLPPGSKGWVSFLGSKTEVDFCVDYPIKQDRIILVREGSSSPRAGPGRGKPGGRESPIL
jgi:hypothetical protein